MDPGPPIVISPREVLEVIKGIPQRKLPDEDGIPKKSSVQVASQPDDDLQRRTSPRVLSFRVEICKDSPCSETQEGPSLI
ncbi:hypothetical protein Trydic_g13629 [Trypoxylus dichotomus]